MFPVNFNIVSCLVV